MSQTHVPLPGSVVGMAILLLLLATGLVPIRWVEEAAALLLQRISLMLLPALVVAPPALLASSHREAPLIAEDPAADGTDVYVFRSPDAPNTVTLMAAASGGNGQASAP